MADISLPAPRRFSDRKTAVVGGLMVLTALGVGYERAYVVKLMHDLREAVTGKGKRGPVELKLLKSGILYNAEMIDAQIKRVFKAYENDRTEMISTLRKSIEKAGYDAHIHAGNVGFNFLETGGTDKNIDKAALSPENVRAHASNVKKNFNAVKAWTTDFAVRLREATRTAYVRSAEAGMKILHAASADKSFKNRYSTRASILNLETNIRENYEDAELKVTPSLREQLRDWTRRAIKVISTKPPKAEAEASRPASRGGIQENRHRM